MEACLFGSYDPGVPTPSSFSSIASHCYTTTIELHVKHERLPSLQLERGTVWQLQYSPQSHSVLFVAAWKLNCSRALTADTVCLTTELRRDSFSLSQQLLLLLQPWSWSINYNVAMTFINNNNNNNNCIRRDADARVQTRNWFLSS